MKLSTTFRSVDRRRLACMGASAVVSIIAIGLNTPVEAQSTYNPTTTNSYNVSGNFTPTGVPNGTGVTVTFAAPTAADTISLNAAITLGTLNFTNNSAFIETLQAGTGSLTLNNGGSEAAINFSGTTVMTNALTISTAISLVDTLRFTNNTLGSGAGTATITGALTGAGGFIKDGVGRFTFSSVAKTYTGATTIAQGRLRYTASGQSTGTSAVTVNNTGSLYLDQSGGAFSFGNAGGALLTINGAGDSDTLGSLVDANSNTTTLANAVALGSASTINVVTATATFQLNGAVSGSSMLTKVGPGTLNFNAANSGYTGGTTVTNGAVTVSAASNLGSGALSFAQTTAVNTAVTLNNAAQTIGPLSSTFTNTTGTQTQTLTLNGTALTVNQTADSTFGPGSVSTLSSTITGTGSVILSNTSNSKLTLAGANTYTGGTTVNGGTLLATNTTGSATGTGPVIINDNAAVLGGGTLSGVGGVAGPVMVISGEITAGTAAAPAVLTVGALTLSPNSTTLLALNSGTPARGSTYSGLNIGGAVTVDGALSLTGTYTATPGSGEVFFLLDNTSNSATTGTFASVSGLPTGYGVIYGANFETNSLSGGNDIALAEVPEPSTVAVVFGLVCLVFWKERRRLVGRRDVMTFAA